MVPAPRVPTPTALTFTVVSLGDAVEVSADLD